MEVYWAQDSVQSQRLGTYCDVHLVPTPLVYDSHITDRWFTAFSSKNLSVYIQFRRGFNAIELGAQCKYKSGINIMLIYIFNALFEPFFFSRWNHYTTFSKSFYKIYIGYIYFNLLGNFSHWHTGLKWYIILYIIVPNQGAEMLQTL